MSPRFGSRGLYPPASCTTIRHSTKIVSVCIPLTSGATEGDPDGDGGGDGDEEPDPCTDELPERFTQTFTGDDVISTSTPHRRSHLVPLHHHRRLYGEPRRPHLRLRNQPLQRRPPDARNTSDQATEISGELTFEEGLALAPGSGTRTAS